MNECDFVGITLAMIIKNNISFEYYYSSHTTVCIISVSHSYREKYLGSEKKVLKENFLPHLTKVFLCALFCLIL